MHATSLLLLLLHWKNRIQPEKKREKNLRYNGKREHHCVHVAMDVAVKMNVIISAVCIRQVMRQRNYSTLNTKVRTVVLLLLLMVAELQSFFSLFLVFSLAFHFLWSACNKWIIVLNEWEAIVSHFLLFVRGILWHHRRRN